MQPTCTVELAFCAILLEATSLLFYLLEIGTNISTLPLYYLCPVSLHCLSTICAQYLYIASLLFVPSISTLPLYYLCPVSLHCLIVCAQFCFSVTCCLYCDSALFGIFSSFVVAFITSTTVLVQRPPHVSNKFTAYTVVKREFRVLTISSGSVTSSSLNTSVLALIAKR